jgi:hypothetical protein
VAHGDIALSRLSEISRRGGGQTAHCCYSLSGRAEDYLVKEFVAFVHDATDGRRFVYTNYPTVLKRTSISFHRVGQSATLTPLTTSSFRIRVCHRFKRPLINTVDAFYGQVPVYSIKQVTAKKLLPKISASHTTGGWSTNSCILARKYSLLGAYESSSSWIHARRDVSWMGAGNSQSSA